MKTIYKHSFTPLAGSEHAVITRIDLSRLETIEHYSDKSKAKLFMIQRAAPIEIYCTPESFDALLAEWEKVRGFVVRLV